MPEESLLPINRRPVIHERVVFGRIGKIIPLVVEVANVKSHLQLSAETVGLRETAILFERNPHSLLYLVVTNFHLLQSLRACLH